MTSVACVGHGRQVEGLNSRNGQLQGLLDAWIACIAPAMVQWEGYGWLFWHMPAAVGNKTLLITGSWPGPAEHGAGHSLLAKRSETSLQPWLQQQLKQPLGSITVLLSQAVSCRLLQAAKEPS